MIRRWLLRAVPAGWRDALEGDLQEQTRHLPRGVRGVAIAVMILLVAVRMRWARAAERVPLDSSFPVRWLGDASRDARYGVRRWLARPVFSLAALLTIALGIGTASALFSVVDGVLLKPLPYPSADRLVSINRTYPDWTKDPVLASGWDRISLAYPEFFHVRARARTLEALAVVTTRTAVLDGPPAEQLRVGVVSASFFRLLGAVASHGTLFDPSADLDDPGTAVVSHEFWRTRLGGDPGVIGRTIAVRGQARVVAGVLPAGFAWGTRRLGYHLWFPLSSVPVNERADNNRNLDAIGLVRPGVSVADVADEMTHLLRENFRYTGATGGTASPFMERQIQRVRGPLLLLLAGAGLLLVIACANVAGLLMGDAASRDTEMAVRSSLGASRGRVLRQLLAESLVLAGAGAAGGLLVAAWAVTMLVALAPADMPRVSQIALDRRAVAVAAAAAIATAVLFALAPSVGGWRRRGAFSGATRSVTARRRATAVLASAEIALGIALLTGAGLFARSLGALHGVDAGFDRSNLLAIRAGLPPTPSDDGVRSTRFFAGARGALSRLPGVVDVAVSSTLPLASGRSSTTISVRDPLPGRAPQFDAQRRFVSPEFFRTARVRLLSGRLFEPSDTAQSPAVAVVSRAMEQRVWPSGATGRTFTYARVEHTVVGVVNDVRDLALDSEPQATFYLSTAQRPAWAAMYLIARTSGDPLALAGEARRVLARIDPEVPVHEIRTMDDVVGEATDDERYRAVLMGLFSTAAFVLAGIGLYSTLTRRVQDREREIGVRLALGARPSQVRRMFLAEGMRLALFGTAVGVPLALLFGRGAGSLLYGVAPDDPLTLGVVVALVAVLALSATYVPSVRASRQDPVRALRA